MGQLRRLQPGGLVLSRFCQLEECLRSRVDDSGINVVSLQCSFYLLVKLVINEWNLKSDLTGLPVCTPAGLVFTVVAYGALDRVRGVPIVNLWVMDSMASVI